MNDEMMNQYEEEGNSDNTLKGYRIIILILVVVIAVLGFQYFRQVNILRGSEESLTIERDTLKNRLSTLILDMDNIKGMNDSMSVSLNGERQRADSLFDKLKSERNWSYAKIKKYEKELTTLRNIVKVYVGQIDSLNRVNVKLSKENINYRRQMSSLRSRAEMAEEKQQELDSKVKQGAVISAGNVEFVALTGRDKRVDKAKHATRLSVSLVLNPNSLASVGERNVYIRIKGPDGAVLSDSPNSLFEYNGEKILYTAMRSDVDYQGTSLDVTITYSGNNFSKGTYSVDIFMDGHVIGSSDLILK